MTERIAVVCAEDELPPGSTREVLVGGRSIAVVNAGGTLYAIRNRCPHQGAPLCRGMVGGTMVDSRPQEWIYGMDQQVLRCPWHGWEFDLASGRSLFDPGRTRVRVYPVDVRDGQVVVVLAPGRSAVPAD